MKEKKTNEKVYLTFDSGRADWHHEVQTLTQTTEFAPYFLLRFFECKKKVMMRIKFETNFLDSSSSFKLEKREASLLKSGCGFAMI